MLKILLQKHTPICSHENTVVKPTRLDLKEPLQILFFSVHYCTVSFHYFRFAASYRRIALVQSPCVFQGSVYQNAEIFSNT